VAARAARGALSQLVLALVVAGAVLCGGAAPGTAAESGWHRVEPGGRTACARGGEYAFWARRGRSDRLVIYFQGGGGCFDTRTCAPGSPWFDDSVGAGDDPSFAGGMLDVADPRNPFRDWSFLFVPSCTGDVHIGDAVARYGPTTIRHRGWANARSALDWAFRRFDPSVVLVTGCSAGSVGSAFHAPAVLARWPGARVSQLGDSLAFLFHRPVQLTDWGAQRRFPAFFRIGARRFTMEEYVTRLARRYPRRTFARFNHAGDDVQERFYEAVGGDPATFGPRLRAVEQRLKRLPNYRSYLACGDEHCAFQTEELHRLRVDGVVLRDWVSQLAGGRNVRCPTCGR
jgi:Pectinacetylesterase